MSIWDVLTIVTAAAFVFLIAVGFLAQIKMLSQVCDHLEEIERLVGKLVEGDDLSEEE